MCQEQQVSSFFVYAWTAFSENNGNDVKKLFLFSKIFPLENTSISFPAYTLNNYSYALSVQIKYDGGMYGASPYGWNITVMGVQKNIVSGGSSGYSMNISILALF